MRNFHYLVIISLFIIGCSNENIQFIGKYERRAELIGCLGIDRMELKNDKTIINWNYDNAGTGKMHLYNIEYGKWKLIKNRIEITNDSIYEYDYNEQLSRILRKISIDSVDDYDCKKNKESEIRCIYGFEKRYLLPAKDTAQSIMLLTKLNDPFNSWAEYNKMP